jgi:hypothetical protein
MPLRGPFDQPADSLPAAVSGFVRDFLTPAMTMGVEDPLARAASAGH